jgi:hypothetical protein
MSYLDPFEPEPLPRRLSVAEGDIVMLGPNAAFRLEVMAVRGDKAWVRDLDDGREGVVDVDSFRRFGGDGPGLLAH